jgi:hypothetical protein
LASGALGSAFQFLFSLIYFMVLQKFLKMGRDQNKDTAKP